MRRATVSMTRYNEPNWLVMKSLNSLLNQKNISLRIIFLDQKKDKNIKEFCDKSLGKSTYINYINIEPKGISYSRNLGLKMCNTRYLFQFDPDQIADEFWAVSLYDFMLKEKCQACLGKTLPLWRKKPLLISKATIIKEIYALLDYGKKEKKNMTFFYAGNVLLDMKFLKKKNLFYNESVGRREGKLISGEDGILSKDILKNGGKIMYFGKSFIYHNIEKERINYFWIMKRLYYGGYTKGLINKKSKTVNKLNIWDKIFMPLILIPYFTGYIVCKVDKFYKKN